MSEDDDPYFNVPVASAALGFTLAASMMFSFSSMVRVRVRVRVRIGIGRRR